jgi:glucosyltransferase
MKSVDLIVPCYNEAEVLPIFYDEVCSVTSKLPDFNFNFIFVDDGSRDATLEVIINLAAKDSRVRYISFSRNFGKEAAMLAGMKYSGGEYVCILDADLQHSPSLVADMLACLETEPQYDVAAARRIDREGEAKFKSLLSKGFYKIINSLSSVDIPESAQDFRVMRRNVVDAVISMPEYNRFSKGIFSWVGFNTKWFAHENRERAAGETKWSLRSLLLYSLDGIIGFSTAPLKIPLYTGAAIGGLGVAYALYLIIYFIARPHSALGLPLAVCGMLVLCGLVLFSLGIIGGYVARIYLEVKNRPIFIVDKTNIAADGDKTR